MKPTKTFNVTANLPEHLEPLRELVYNLRWSWDHESISLFRRLEPKLWEESGHDPARMLGMLSQKQLDDAENDESFLAHLDRVSSDLKKYMERPGWARKTYDISDKPWIAYFSAEFGITESLPLYSGGLGVLAGDYLKTSSDLDSGVVGVGILYRQGYFTQYLNPDGWQQEHYNETDFYNAPVRLVQRDGRPVVIEIPHPQPPARAQIWHAQVGRVSLYLMDTNLPGNSEAARQISNRLYAQGSDIRLQQEILLGIGGVRVLRELGIDPLVYHLNEGHSAFLSLERIRLLMKENGLSFKEACHATFAGNVFTTHTPVPAASDHFGQDQVEKYLGSYIRELGVPVKEIMELGIENGDGSNPRNFGMLCTTVLALRTAAYSFGVSKLHGETSRRIWGHVWPNVPEEDVPISDVTNGVHISSWVSKEMASLYERYIGPRWHSQPADSDDWKHIESVPDEELWQTHERRRQRLVAYARNRLKQQLIGRGAPASEVEAADSVLDSRSLTIGFARRFTGYKRANLLFRDIARLKSILFNSDCPVQIILAGKAHPADTHGKELIRQAIHYIRDEGLRDQMVFLEDYDMPMARYLVEGVDVWLNTPRRPLEASGTSGMKAAANGALNVSVLDGWWAEAYQKIAEIGWAIGHGEEYEDAEYQDTVESRALFDILEREVVPTFYDVGNNGIPRRWIKMMKSAIRNICPLFHSNRMVREYLENYYVPAAKRARDLQENNFERTRRLSGWADNIKRRWKELEIKQVDGNEPENLKVGSKLSAGALVKMGGLSPDDIAVDLCLGKLDGKGEIVDTQEVNMSPVEQGVGDEIWFRGEVECDSSGRHGYSVRILPKHPDLHDPYSMNLIIWSQ